MLNKLPYKGLYRSSFEHDACGVGLICNLNNRKEHALVRDALKILGNLTHRGACGCDETTGNGAGILIQKPHLFLQQAAREATIHLPAEIDYAAGLACAQQLNTAGHTVVVFERDPKPGGLLRYGIPDFKLEKPVVDRRLDLMEREGIVFRTGIQAGVDIAGETLCADFDAIVVCCGATRPRDLPIPGRELDGIHFTMNFLTGQNHVVSGEADTISLNAGGQQVIVIGGGDTGSDCIGTSHRQGAASVLNFELLPQPSEDRPASQPWPYWPMRLRTSSSHEEGGSRNWNILTKRFVGDTNRVRALETVRVQWNGKAGRPDRFEEIPGSQKTWPADLVLLAMGFVGPDPDTLVAQLGLALDARGNLSTGIDFMTSRPGVFAAGDARRGQSLIVWAISEGREAARAVDMFLMGRTDLPEKGCCDLPRV